VGESVTLRTKADCSCAARCACPAWPTSNSRCPSSPRRQRQPDGCAALQQRLRRPAPAAQRLAAHRHAHGQECRCPAQTRAGHTDKPQDLHLFDTAGLIDYAAAQPVTEENGTLILTLPIAKDAAADATRLAGVLVSSNGWDR